MQAVSKESINCGAEKQRLKNKFPLKSSVVLHHTDDEANGDGLLSHIAAVKSSNHLLHIPRKSPQSQIRGLEVFLVKLVHNAVDGLVGDDADDGVVQGRPGVGAVVRFARVAAVAFDFVPFCKTLDSVVV